MTVLVDVALALLVAACWVSAAALLRLSRGMDRLHVVSFVPLASSPLLLLIAIVQMGATSGTAKVAFLWLFNALTGVGTAHALGRLMRPGEGGDA